MGRGVVKTSETASHQALTCKLCRAEANGKWVWATGWSQIPWSTEPWVSVEEGDETGKGSWRCQDVKDLESR